MEQLPTLFHTAPEQPSSFFLVGKKCSPPPPSIPSGLTFVYSWILTGLIIDTLWRLSSWNNHWVCNSFSVPMLVWADTVAFHISGLARRAVDTSYILHGASSYEAWKSCVFLFLFPTFPSFPQDDCQAGCRILSSPHASSSVEWFFSHHVLSNEKQAVFFKVQCERIKRLSVTECSKCGCYTARKNMSRFTTEHATVRMSDAVADLKQLCFSLQSSKRLIGSTAGGNKAGEGRDETSLFFYNWVMEIWVPRSRTDAVKLSLFSC